MNPALSSSAIGAYVFVALLGLIILRRSYRMVQGAPISSVRLVAFPVVYVLLYVGELAVIGVGAAGTSVAVAFYAAFGADAALVVGGVLVSYRYTLRHVQIYQAPGSAAWSYRLNALLPVIYVALFFVRTGIETVLLNESPFAFPTAASLVALPTVSLYLLFVVDALWGLSTGFLIGRSLGVYHEWQEKLRSSTPAAGPALP
jgi:hypothetical protein